jgi:glycosyltransferase involved in cell wall biosynthesis
MESKEMLNKIYSLITKLKINFQEKLNFIMAVFGRPSYYNFISVFSFFLYKLIFLLKKLKGNDIEKRQIGIDARILHNNISGLERYIYQLIVHLSRIDNERYYSIFLHYPAFDNKICHNFKQHVQQNPSKYITSQNKKIAFEEIDVFHVTWQEMFLYHNLPLLWSKSSVLTVHDLINLLHTEYHHPIRRYLYKLLLKSAVKWADRIITVSEYTKQDIIKHLNADESKIRVIYQASDHRFHPMLKKEVVEKVKLKYSIHGKYILSVGKSYTHKNIPHLIKAFNNLLSRESIEHQLVLIGDKFWGPANLETQKTIAELNIEKKINWIGFVDDEDMPAIYNGAELFAFPSYFEGFGLPLLEAMSCGVPVVASNVTSIPEVIGDAGLLVSPTNVEELTLNMEAILKDKELKDFLIKKGLERSKKFSWEKCATETLKVYNELL